MFSRLLFCLAAALLAAAPASAASPKISAALARQAKSTSGYVEVLIQPDVRADLSGLSLWRTQAARGGEALARLRAAAESRQGAIRAWLDARGFEHRDYWLVNMVWARVPAAALEELAARDDVALISADSRVRQAMPPPQPTAKAAAAIEWGVVKIRAPQVWAAGFNGQGVVVAGADTGYQWDHPALKSHYRGWNGASASHAYNWHDAIHDPPGGGPNPCGYDTVAPCDDAGHGTHTMGTIVGDDGGANQIGVAPGARWIACRNMDQGDGTPSRYIECFQFFVAPTDANGANPMPALAPQVINNSWTCPPSEGCDAASTELLRQAVAATVAAGIFVVASAGNSGPSCSTIDDPPATFAESFSIGATDSGDLIAGFSSRGPGPLGLKPDVSAPGVNVRSSYPTNTYAGLSGTSMAGPHAVGAVALLLSAAPALKGNVPGIAAALRAGAVPYTSAQDCGAYPGAQVPNAVFGHGRIDAFSTWGAIDTMFEDDFE